MARKRKSGRSRTGLGGAMGALLLAGGGLLLYFMSKRQVAGGAGLSGAFSIQGIGPPLGQAEIAGVSGVVVGGASYASAQIAFNGAINNSGNVAVPGVLGGLTIHVAGVPVRSTALTAQGDVPANGSLPMLTTEIVFGSDPPGIVTAVAAVFDNATPPKLLATQTSATLALVEAGAVVTLTGAFTATGR